MKRLFNKKVRSAVEKAWRKAFSDERWERRADRLMFLFSQPSGLLPRTPRR
jgi:hypothetical protein